MPCNALGDGCRAVRVAMRAVVRADFPPNGRFLSNHTAPPCGCALNNSGGQRGWRRHHRPFRRPRRRMVDRKAQRTWEDWRCRWGAAGTVYGLPLAKSKRTWRRGWGRWPVGLSLSPITDRDHLRVRVAQTQAQNCTGLGKWGGGDVLHRVRGPETGHCIARINSAQVRRA